MKIIVVGGAGFIGSHLVDNYLADGHEVVVVDNLCSGKIENLNPEARFYLMDIYNPDLEKIFSIEKSDIVNIQAAQKSVPQSVG